MDEPAETPYAMWLTDFCSDDVEHNVKTEADFSTASINTDRISGWQCGDVIFSSQLAPAMILGSKAEPYSFTAEKIKCGTVSTVPSLLGVGLTLKTELEKARARIAELEAQLSTAQQRIAAMEAEPVKQAKPVDGDPDWDMPRSLLPRGI